MQELIARAKELLADGTVARVLGWKAGDLPYNPNRLTLRQKNALKDFVYNGFLRCKLKQIYDRSFQTGRKDHGMSETL